MKHFKYWIIFVVFLLSQVLTGAALAEAPAQEITPEEEKIIESAIDSAGTDLVSYDYAFSHTMGTFTPITGGTVHGTTSNDDTSFPAINLGFTFLYDGVAYTQVSIQSNGFIAMGAIVSNSYTPISTGVSNNVVAALGRDIQGNGTNAELMSLMEGTEPNRIFTVQWSHYKRYGSNYAGDDFNFQIKLYETTQKIEFVYGPFTAVYNAAPPTVQVGLRGASNADFNNRTTTTDWTATTAGATNAATMALTDLVYPPSGLTYNWVYSITPVSDPDFTTDPVIGWKDYPVTFTASVGAGSPPIQYDWNFGDGTTGTGQVVEHTYADVGTYTVTLTASNNGGEYTDSITRDVEVVMPPMISIDPTNLHATQHPDVTTTQTFEICNIGDATLDWELKEVDAAPPLTQAPVPETRKTYEIMRKADGSVDCAAYQNYTGFEPAEVAAACPVSMPVIETSGIMAPDDIGYALDIGYVSDNFVSFALNNFPGQTIIGTNATAFYGMDFDPSGEVLWALNDVTDELGTIDLTTGAFTGVVPCPPGGGAANWTGMTIDPVTGTVYASTATDLYTIDPATGAATLIGSFGTTTMIEIAMNMEGAMYGHDITSDAIYLIDPTTGAATLIGLTGYAANYAQGMDFDNDDGTLYIFLYIGSGANVYGTVNLTTGAVTPLSTDSPLGEFEGAIAIPGVPFDIPWASEDTLSGSLAGGACQDVTVTFDSTGLAAGDYFGALEIESNDPAMPMAVVDLQLTVFSTVTMVYYDLEDVVHVGENIYVAGDFNGWSTSLDMMVPNPEYSEFTFTFGILDGTYGYKYVVDTGTIHWNWLQSANRSVIVDGDVTVDDFRNVVPGYYELTWPDTMTVLPNTPSENVYGQIWADDLTSEGVQPRSLPVELGYGVDSDPSLWTNWTLMSYNVSVGNNAEYMGSITPTESGVFSYAIKLNPNWGTGNPNDMWYYADTEWDGVYLPDDAGVMTVLYGIFLPLVMK